MRHIYWILAAMLILLVLILFRDPIIDFLPIDQSGWSTSEHGQCYLDEDGDPVSGWYDIEGVSYYFHTETHTPHTGWTEKDGIRCYVEGGQVCSGWTDTPEGRFYLKEDGSLHIGWQRTPEGLRYFDQAGFLCTGMVETDKGIYCFNEDGSPHSGWYDHASKRYFCNSNGTLYTGWLEQDGKKYYLTEDGSAATGKLEIDGQAFFFSSTGMNFILVNPWHALPEDFTVELDFVESAGVNPVCKADLEQMLADCRAAGFSPRILSGYRSIRDQEYNFNVAVGKRVARGYAYKTAYDYVRQNIAVPGTSEHHLGLAFDIVDSHFPYLETTQERTETQQWLMENCWNYGFIMRYPNGTTEITGIVYEPWHYRYVGREMAAEIHELGITLEEYVDMLTGDGTTCGGAATSES